MLEFHIWPEFLLKLFYFQCLGQVLKGIFLGMLECSWPEFFGLSIHSLTWGGSWQEDTNNSSSSSWVFCLKRHSPVLSKENLRQHVLKERWDLANFPPSVTKKDLLPFPLAQYPSRIVSPCLMVLFATVKHAVSAVFVIVSRLRHMEAKPLFA
jgi:hypothetical protein